MTSWIAGCLTLNNRSSQRLRIVWQWVSVGLFPFEIRISTYLQLDRPALLEVILRSGHLLELIKIEWIWLSPVFFLAIQLPIGNVLRCILVRVCLLEPLDSSLRSDRTVIDGRACTILSSLARLRLKLLCRGALVEKVGQRFAV